LRRQFLQIVWEPSGFRVEEFDGLIESRTQNSFARGLFRLAGCAEIIDGCR
jgi:hypothetical protein